MGLCREQLTARFRLHFLTVSASLAMSSSPHLSAAAPDDGSLLILLLNGHDGTLDAFTSPAHAAALSALVSLRGLLSPILLTPDAASAAGWDSSAWYVLCAGKLMPQPPGSPLHVVAFDLARVHGTARALPALEPPPPPSPPPPSPLPPADDASLAVEDADLVAHLAETTLPGRCGEAAALLRGRRPLQRAAAAAGAAAEEAAERLASLRTHAAPSTLPIRPSTPPPITRRSDHGTKTPTSRRSSTPACPRPPSSPCAMRAAGRTRRAAWPGI